MGRVAYGLTLTTGRRINCAFIDVMARLCGKSNGEGLHTAASSTRGDREIACEHRSTSKKPTKKVRSIAHERFPAVPTVVARLATHIRGGPHSRRTRGTHRLRCGF